MAVCETFSTVMWGCDLRENCGILYVAVLLYDASVWDHV
jgi:hypothetical protein